MCQALLGALVPQPDGPVLFQKVQVMNTKEDLEEPKNRWEEAKEPDSEGHRAACPLA